MTAPLRWLLVALLAVAVAAPPTVLRLWPASGSSLSAAQVADRARAARTLGWSGEVHTTGNLKLPAAGSFGNVAKLFGENSDLRVWWHDQQNWRVDRTRGSGETDLMRNDDRLVRWTYESRRVVTTRYSDIRLPDESDLLPSTLARRMLAGTADSELSRLPSHRVAGRSASGLRLVPSDARSTIAHVDMWIDQRTGLPLEVLIYAHGGRVPVLSSVAASVQVRAPSLDETGFAFPDGVRVDRSFAIDDAAGANAFAPFRMPDTLVGLPRRGNPEELGAVGIYGRGPTSILAIPLRRHVARELFDQLRKSKAATIDSESLSIRLGPLSVVLFGNRLGSFLLVGTVTPATLATADSELQATVGREGFR